MADSSDVEAALAGVVLAALAAVPGMPQARVYRGFPSPVLLDNDLAAGVPHVTVAAGSPARNTTRYLHPPVIRSSTVATLTVAASPGQAVFGGAGGAGQVAGVLVGGVGWALRLGATDTPASVAAGLAAMVPGAVAQGGTLQAAGLSAARIGVDQSVTQEVRREQRRYRIAFWCPGPDMRDQLVRVVDPAVSAMNFLTLADGSKAHVVPAGEEETDRAEVARLWRRDLLFDVEFAVTQVVSLPEMLFGTLVASLPGGGELQAGDQVMPDAALGDGSGAVLEDGLGHVLGQFS